MTPLRLRYWDARLHAAIGALPDTPADRWLRRLTTTADHGRLWIAIGVLLGLRRGRSRRAAVRGLGSLTVASTVVNAVLKRLFGRVRPDLDAMAGHRRLPRAPHTLSFPSGHSSSAGAFATGVALESPLAGAALAPLALAVGYSRVHVGVHYPGDVVSGLAIGAGVALAGRRWWPVRPTEPARVRPARSAPALPRGEGLVVAVNPRSGPPDHDPVAQVRRLLPAAEVHGASPGSGITDLLEEAARSGRAQALGVAGGDGSVAAAAAVALAHGLPLAVVPAGTLNHFARDLGVETPEEAAGAVEAGRAVSVDVADVNGTPFLNTASIGVYPEMVRRRDALAGRLGRWVAMAVAAAQVLRAGRRCRWCSTGGRSTSGSCSSATAATPRAGWRRPGGHGWRTACSTCSTCAPTSRSAAPGRCSGRCWGSATACPATRPSPPTRCTCTCGRVRSRWPTTARRVRRRRPSRSASGRR